MPLSSMLIVDPRLLFLTRIAWGEMGNNHPGRAIYPKRMGHTVAGHDGRPRGLHPR
jgi:hypothetical protein